MGKFLQYLWAAGLIATAGVIVCALAEVMGTWVGLVVWGVGTAVLCFIAAALLKGAGTGKVSWRNRLAGYLLPWGFTLGRGKLVGITAVAWATWVLIGAAAAVLLSFGARAHSGLAVVLFYSWMLYGALINRQMGLALGHFRTNPKGRGMMLRASAAMAGVIGVTAGLWVCGRWALATELAVAPIVVLGAISGFYMGIALLGGRKGRWN